MRRVRSTLLAAVAVASLLAGCAAAPAERAAPRPDRDAPLLAALDELPDSSTQVRPARLAAGLVPPTNRWFSGLVFGEQPQPVFPTPLSVTPQEHGFAIGLPTPTATADTIFGSAVPGLGVTFPGRGLRVTDYDDLTVTASYGPADVTLAEGWPYVAVTARTALDATLSAPVAAGTHDAAVATIGGVRYAVRAPDGAVRGTRLRLDAGERAVLYALPTGVPAAVMAEGAAAPVTGSRVRHTVAGDEVRTRLTYRTADDAPTVLAALPHQQAGGARCRAGRVPSMLGPLALCRGRAIEFTVPRAAAADAVDLAGAPASRLEALRRQVARDVEATPDQPADTYASGKWLYRMANLLQVAKASGATAATAEAGAVLQRALLEWTDPAGCGERAVRCFVHDEQIGGVVGLEPAYGSEQFNDHHFHYGYFLYAAAVAVADRPALKPRIAPVIDLLAADIAAPAAAGGMPALRTFDPYAGHSWASGYSPFADGNNQESTSEAVNAWNGLALWASVTDRPGLRRTATWLLSSEAATAKAYWVAPDLTAFPEFRHEFVALSWGGKRDSATWFSADPAAKFAIQLIPMHPASGYLRGPEQRMRANLTEARSADTGLFADYLLMYEAMQGGSADGALRRLDAIPDSGIDTANSRSYATAWILAQERD